jgi:hypothetical protein
LLPFYSPPKIGKPEDICKNCTRFAKMIFKLGSLLLLSSLSVQVIAQEGACDLCIDGAEPNLSPDFSFFTQAEFTCSELVIRSSDMAVLDTPSASDCKDLQYLAFQIGCCYKPPSRLNAPLCHMCGDDMEVEDPDKVYAGVGQEEITCAQALQFTESITSEMICEELTATPREMCCVEKSGAAPMGLTMTLLLAGAATAIQALFF